MLQPWEKALSLPLVDLTVTGICFRLCFAQCIAAKRAELTLGVLLVFSLRHFWQGTGAKRYVFSRCAGQPAVGTPQDELLLYMITIPGHKEDQHIKVKETWKDIWIKIPGYQTPFAFQTVLRQMVFLPLGSSSKFPLLKSNVPAIRDNF